MADIPLSRQSMAKFRAETFGAFSVPCLIFRERKIAHKEWSFWGATSVKWQTGVIRADYQPPKLRSGFRFKILEKHSISARTWSMIPEKRNKRIVAQTSCADVRWQNSGQKNFGLNCLFHAQYDWMTGVPQWKWMGEVPRPVPRLYPLRPFVLYFV